MLQNVLRVTHLPPGLLGASIASFRKLMLLWVRVFLLRSLMGKADEFWLLGKRVGVTSDDLGLLGLPKLVGFSGERASANTWAFCKLTFAVSPEDLLCV